MATQEDRIVDILRDRQWHCSNEFVAAYMPRFSAVIWTLRNKRGFIIESKQCDLHRDKGHSPYMFRLVEWPAGQRVKEQLSWF